MFHGNGSQSVDVDLKLDDLACNKISKWQLSYFTITMKQELYGYLENHLNPLAHNPRLNFEKVSLFVFNYNFFYNNNIHETDTLWC